jgi:hypothetical protein
VAEMFTLHELTGFGFVISDILIIWHHPEDSDV